MLNVYIYTCIHTFVNNEIFTTVTYAASDTHNGALCSWRSRGASGTLKPIRSDVTRATIWSWRALHGHTVVAVRPHDTNPTCLEADDCTLKRRWQPQTHTSARGPLGSR